MGLAQTKQLIELLEAIQPEVLPQLVTIELSMKNGERFLLPVSRVVTVTDAFDFGKGPQGAEILITNEYGSAQTIWTKEDRREVWAKINRQCAAIIRGAIVGVKETEEQAA